MDSNKQRACIIKSLEVKIASEKARLAKLQKEGIPFDRENPLSGIMDGLRGGITWEEKTSGKIRQLLLLPLLIVMFLLVTVLLPFIYITHLRDVHKKKQELKKEITELEDVLINKSSALQYDYQKDKKRQGTLSFLGVKSDKDIFTSDIPKDNTLWSLWILYGLKENTFSSVERISLVRDWIDILYGQAVTSKLNIEERVKETIDRNAEAGKHFYESSKGEHHNCILFMNPVDSVIRALSEELPIYI